MVFGSNMSLAHRFEHDCSLWNLLKQGSHFPALASVDSGRKVSRFVFNISFNK